MSGAAKAWGPERMCGHYRIDMGTWSTMQNMWAQSIAADPHFQQRVDQEAARLQQGGAPRVVNALSFQDLERGAAQVGDAIGNLFGGVAKAIAPPSVGTLVMVTWSDGKKYPGTVAQVAPGQYLVKMGDGAQHWIAAGYVTLP